MMNKKDAEKIIKYLSEKPFVCSEHCIETEKYFITEKVQSKPMTNADVIRNMTDEELAEFLCKIDTMGTNPKSIWNGDFWIDEGEDLLEWLQAEVKEGAE